MLVVLQILCLHWFLLWRLWVALRGKLDVPVHWLVWVCENTKWMIIVAFNICDKLAQVLFVLFLFVSFLTIFEAYRDKPVDVPAFHVLSRFDFVRASFFLGKLVNSKAMYLGEFWFELSLLIKLRLCAELVVVIVLLHERVFKQGTFGCFLLARHVLTLLCIVNIFLSRIWGMSWGISTCHWGLLYL